MSECVVNGCDRTAPEGSGYCTPHGVKWGRSCCEHVLPEVYCRTCGAWWLGEHPCHHLSVPSQDQPLAANAAAEGLSEQSAPSEGQS